MKKRYKIILALIVTVGIIVSVRSCVVREEADLTIAYIGHDFVNRSLFEENRDEINAIVGDVDSNGTQICDITEISFNENLSTADLSNAKQKMAYALGQGNARVYIMEKSFFDSNKDSGVYADLSYLSEDGLKNSDGEIIGIDVSGNEKLEKLGIKTDGTYIALRAVTEMDGVWNKNVEKTDEAARRLVEYILY
jgi:hypothetical protein